MTRVALAIVMPPDRWGSWRGVPGGSPGQRRRDIDDRRGEQYRAEVAAGADMAAAAVGATWQHLASAVPGAWSLRDGGAIAWVSGVVLPTLNGVWAERADPDRDAVAALLDRVKAVGLPPAAGRCQPAAGRAGRRPSDDPR